MTKATQPSEHRRRFLKTVPAAIGVAAVPGAVLAGPISSDLESKTVDLPGRWTLAYAPLPERIESDGAVMQTHSQFQAMSQTHSGESTLDSGSISVRVHGMQGVDLKGFKQARIDLQHSAHCRDGDVSCSVWSAEMAAVENSGAGTEFYVPLDGSGLDLDVSLSGQIQTSGGVVNFEDTQSLRFSTASLSAAHKLREGVYAIGLPFDQRSLAGQACTATDSGDFEVAGTPSAYLLFSIHRAS